MTVNACTSYLMMNRATQRDRIAWKGLSHAVDTHVVNFEWLDGNNGWLKNMMRSLHILTHNSGNFFGWEVFSFNDLCFCFPFRACVSKTCRCWAMI